jgi:hypothetical protein
VFYEQAKQEPKFREQNKNDLTGYVYENMLHFNCKSIFINAVKQILPSLPKQHNQQGASLRPNDNNKGMPFKKGNMESGASLGHNHVLSFKPVQVGRPYDTCSSANKSQAFFKIKLK